MKLKVIFITTKNKAEAVKIAKALLEKKLAVCCNIISEIESFYWWNGKIENSKEALLLVKTSERKEKLAAELVLKMHSYEVPSIESADFNHLNPKYKRWFEFEILKPGKKQE